MRRYVTFLVLLLSIFSSAAQENIADQITTSSIKSSFLNQDRQILIYTTGSNKNLPNNLPTIYLLDGKENFLLTAGIVSNLVRSELIPNVNLVGINTYDYKREYDLSTKTTSKQVYFKTGGYDNFQKFITDEVIKYAKSKISTSNYKILIGHSLGGFFGYKVLIDRPNSFSSVILIDPSTWWNEGEIIQEIKENKEAFNNISMYTARSQDDEVSVKKYDDPIKNIIGSKGKTFDRFSKENHISVLTPSIFKGLKHLFFDYSSLEKLYGNLEFNKLKSTLESLSTKYDTSILPEVRYVAPFARGYTKKGEYESSIKILKYLKKFYPKHIMVLNFLGEAYQKKGDYKNAKKTYLESLEEAKSKKSPMTRWIQKRLDEIKS